MEATPRNGGIASKELGGEPDGKAEPFRTVRWQSRDKAPRARNGKAWASGPGTGVNKSVGGLKARNVSPLQSEEENFWARDPGASLRFAPGYSISRLQRENCCPVLIFHTARSLTRH
jgi:hypothetical protein